MKSKNKLILKPTLNEQVKLHCNIIGAYDSVHDS